MTPIKATAREQAALLALLQAGLWETEPENRSAFRLSAESWDIVFRLARQQTVTGMAIRGLHYLPGSLLPPESLLICGAATTDAIERKNQQMNQALESLYTAFREQGLQPILQKGQGTARFYEQPLLRESGDIDLYFHDRPSWEKALACLQSRQIRINRNADGSLSYLWQGIIVEHHRHLFDLYNPSLQRLAHRLEQAKGFSRFALSSATEISVPSPFLDLLLQNLHILKHALSRGIGLRQLCDLARTCYRLRGDIDPAEMKAIYRELGLARWTSLLHRFLTDCLGLPASCLPYPETAPSAQPLADIIWRGGNFGQYDSGLSHEATGWQRKWQTARSFGRNVRFAVRYAPKEASWFFIQLAKGQFK